MTDQTYDAHSTASEGELTFTLQAGDPYGASLIRLWAALMSGELGQVSDCLDELRSVQNKQALTDNSYGEAQMARGKHTKAYEYARVIRFGGTVAETEKYDAHETAEDLEKTFTLQAGDPYCADIAEIWAALITGNANELEIRFTHLLGNFVEQAKLKHQFGRRQLEKGKVTMAYTLASAFDKHLAQQL